MLKINFGFRKKVILAIFFITFLTSAVISAIFYQQSALMVERNYVSFIRQNLAVFNQVFENIMRDAYAVSVQLACSDDLRADVTAYLESKSMEDALAISSFLKENRSEGGSIDSIYLYLPESSQVITSTEYHATQEIFFPYRYPWIALAEDHPEGSGLTPVILEDRVSRLPRYTMTYYAQIETASGDSLGFLAVNLDERHLFYQLLSAGEKGTGVRTYLVDGSQRIASSAVAEQMGMALTDVEPLAAELSLSSGQGVAQLGEEIVVSLRSPFTGYAMICFSDRGEILQGLREQQFFVFIGLLISFLVMAMFAVPVSLWLYHPVKKLKDTMVNERMQKKEAELEALQYQITPHFMYNTLNSIKYAAVLQHADRIAELLGAFIELLQASISRQGAFITVDEELRMVKHYVTLQQFRYMETLTITYEVEPQALPLFVPRLILQPLIENAILHGRNPEEGISLITVEVKGEGEMLSLSVTDNGRGMTPAEIEELLRPKGKNTAGGGRFSGIGIPNTRERLHLYYGTKGTLSYLSTTGKGTCAKITLPQSLDRTEYEL